MRSELSVSNHRQQFDYEHASFDEWLKYIFEDCVDEEHRCAWIPEPPTSAGNANVLRHCIRLFREPKVVLDRYSEQTIAKVLWAIPGIDAFGPCFGDQRVEFTLRAEAVDTIYELFDQVFRRFSDGPIRSSGFMWWEHFWVYCRDEQRLADRVLGLLDRLLRMPEDHVQESALHGLNEFWSERSASRIATIIDKYLRQHRSLDRKLHEYALLCREGHAQ